MKLAQEYAHLLRELPIDRKHDEHFFALLKRRGHIKLLPSILSAYERIIAKESKTAGEVVVVAHEKDTASAKKKAAEFGGADVRVHVDHSVIGGWRFTGKSTLVDHTDKRALLDLYRKMTA